MSDSLQKKLLNETDNFDAVLRDVDGKICEPGFASINAETKAIDFVGNFVPLMDFNSPATVTKVIDGVECHRFSGRVYLSSKARLQLADVSETLLSLHELHYPQNVDIAADAHYIEFIPAPLNRFGKRKIGAKDETVLHTDAVSIFSLSCDEIGFTSPGDSRIIDKVLININTPIRMKDVEVSITKRLEFSSERHVYYGKILGMTAGSKKSMTDFLISKILMFSTR